MPLAALHVAAIFFVALGAIALWRGGRAPWRSGVRRGLLALWLVIGAGLPLAAPPAGDGATRLPSDLMVGRVGPGTGSPG